MADAKDFPELTLLGDWTITNLAPNSTGYQLPISGTNGTASTSNFASVNATMANNSTNLPTGTAAEVTFLEITSPVVNNSGVVYPDVQAWMYPDGTSLQQYQYLDGSYGGNMAPPKANLVEPARQWKFGVPLIDVLQDGLKASANGGQPPKSMALKATGVKYVQALQVALSSTRGFGHGVASDVLITPMRIRAFGYVYTQSMLDKLAGFWAGAFRQMGLRRTIEGLQAIEGAINWTPTVAGFAGGPGGYAQANGSIVHRYANFAQNAIATGTQTPFILSTGNSVNGNPSNVTAGGIGNWGDLGYATAAVNAAANQASAAYVLKELGVVPGVPNIAFTGVAFGQAYVPNPNGFAVGTNILDIPFGNAQPILQDSSRYYSLPLLREPIEIMGENAAVFVTANGTAIGANTAEVGVGGLYIKP